MAITPDIRRMLVRFLLFAPVGPAIGYALLGISLMLAYAAITLFFPFLAYTRECAPTGILGRTTIFFEFGWHFSIAYLVLLAFLVAHFTVQRPLGDAMVLLLASWFIGALLLHTFLFLLGFCPWLDSP